MEAGVTGGASLPSELEVEPRVAPVPASAPEVLQVPEAAAPLLSPREHTAWRWLPWREAADTCFSPSNAEAILLLPQFAA